MKDNEVKIVDSGSAIGGVRVTSDAKRKTAVIKSIEKEAIESILDYFKGEIIGTVKAIDSGSLKESHVGIYYEWGTGVNACRPAGLGLSEAGVSVSGTGYWSKLYNAMDANRYRTGREIVTRSKHINYSGLGKGLWRDMGGNIRITGSKRAGESGDKFRKYIGEDVKAYKWFENAIVVNRSNIIAIISDAVGSVNPFDYFSASPIVKTRKNVRPLIATRKRKY